MTPFGPFEDGSFASLAECEGRAYLAFQTDPRRPSQIRIYDIATLRLVRAYDAGSGAAFPLLKPAGSPLLVAWRRADTARIHYAEPLSDAPPSDLGDIGANNEPFAWEGDWLWWQAADFQIWRANVVTGIGRETAIGQIGRGTGIARIENGRAILRDVDRVAYGLTFPCYAGGHVALEGNTGGMVVVRVADSKVARAFLPLDCFTPKIIGWGSGVLAVTSGSGAVRVVALMAADFVTGPTRLPAPTDPPPVIVVVDPPPAVDPHQQGPAAMELSDKAVDVIGKFIAAFPPPLSKPPGDAKERAFRDYMQQLAEELAAVVDARFGCKNAGGGRPRSKDSLALFDGTTLWAWDIFSGVGEANTRLSITRTAKNLTIPLPENEFTAPQDFEPVSPVDRLGLATPPVVTPPPTDPPPVVVTPPATGDELERLTRIEAKIDHVIALLGQPFKLEARL